MDFTKQILENRRALLDDIDRRIEAALRPFAYDLDCLLATFFSGRLPADWRQRWHAFVADQATKGFTVEPKSIRELEDWIEAWAKFCGLLPLQARSAPNRVTSSEEQPAPVAVIELPADYPTRERIAAAKAWDQFQRQLEQELYDERSEQVLSVRKELREALRTGLFFPRVRRRCLAG